MVLEMTRGQRQRGRFEAQDLASLTVKIFAGSAVVREIITVLHIHSYTTRLQSGHRTLRRNIYAYIGLGDRSPRTSAIDSYLTLRPDA